MRSKEALPQLGRQREGDQEIGSLDELAQLTLDPAGGGGAAALRTGLVIAGVPGEMDPAAIPTTKGPPAQSRGPAMSDGPQGATLRRRKRRSRFQKIRQELTQRRHNGGGSHGFLAWQVAAQLIHQAQRIAGRLMGHVQINHGRGDLFMPEQFLDGVQMSSGLEQVSGEAMTQ